MIINKHNINSIEFSKQELLEQGSTFLIDKELTWTSNDVVSKLRSFFKTKRVGHAGSLDPFATGLLIISIGKDTKKINDYTDSFKKYVGTVKFGAETVSYDAEHPEIKINHLQKIDKSIVDNALQLFHGKIQQTAPVYSAKKINGQRHYELSRKNIIVEPKVKEVEIMEIKSLDIFLPFYEFEVSCSKGTYIRSLANDLGKETGYGAYLFKLIRTQIGEFHLDDALKIGELIKLIK
jgi:tRNA pseudouridine55 synthase